MSTFARSNNYGRAFVAVFVSVGFLWALALGASPQLHQRVHKDANRVEHNCAATMIASITLQIRHWSARRSRHIKFPKFRR